MQYGPLEGPGAWQLPVVIVIWVDVDRYEVQTNDESEKERNTAS
jgi:hypothetical protein